jgi:regulator of RNase E activity RraA
MYDPCRTHGNALDLLYTGVLADTLDRLGHKHGALPHYIRPLAPHWRALGRAVTLSVVSVASEPATPYKVEMECVDALRSGDLLVATTHGDLGSALWGELLSTACKARGCVGVVLDALTRDARQIMAMDYPVWAAGFSPLDSKGRLDGLAFNVPIRIGECLIYPGDWVLADMDGVVVVPQHLAEQAFALALEKVQGENRVREALAAGESVQATFQRYGIL